MDQQAEAIELFRIAEGKIEAVRADVGQMVRHDVELQIKMDRLTERVDNGLSITGQKTLSMVTDLVAKIGEYKIELDQQKLVINAHDRLLERLVNAVFVTATVGVIGGLVAMLWAAVPHVTFDSGVQKLHHARRDR